MAADSEWVDFEGIFEDYELGPPFKFQKQVIDDCYKKATSRSNLAVQLVRRAHSKAERATANCTGDHHYKRRSYPQQGWRQFNLPHSPFTQSDRWKKPGNHIKLP